MSSLFLCRIKEMCFIDLGYVMLMLLLLLLNFLFVHRKYIFKVRKLMGIHVWLSYILALIFFYIPGVPKKTATLIEFQSILTRCQRVFFGFWSVQKYWVLTELWDFEVVLGFRFFGSPGISSAMFRRIKSSF